MLAAYSWDASFEDEYDDIPDWQRLVISTVEEEPIEKRLWICANLLPIVKSFYEDPEHTI